MYIQLDSDYFNHPKTLHLIAMIGSEADVYPPRLWAWAMKYAKDGVLKNKGMVETACRWKDDDGRLHKALVDAGFLEDDGITIHGWMERTGHGIQRYEEKKAREREKYRNSADFCGKNSRVDKSRVDESRVKESNNNPEAASPGWMSLLLSRARDAKVAARGDTLRSYIEAWAARTDAGRVEQILMDPWTRGKTVLEIQNHFFSNGEANGGMPSINEIMANWAKKESGK